MLTEWDNMLPNMRKSGQYALFHLIYLLSKQYKFFLLVVDSQLLTAVFL